MSAAFDPYYKWLGIPPQDQPADHYRLLGITLFESDPQVIESAADRQMVHLRTFATGPNAALSQKLLNEVSAARITLLNRAKKEAYDRSLRARQPRRAVALPVAEALSAGEPSAPAIPDVAAPAFEIPHVEMPLVTAAAPRRNIVRRRSLWQSP